MFLIRLAQSCMLSMHGVRRVSDRTRAQLFLRRLARSQRFGMNLRRADSIFFIIFPFALRRLTSATIEPRTRSFAPLVSDGNNRSIARRMAFSPVSVKVASPFLQYGRSEPDLLVISISCADRSTDLAAWGASAVATMGTTATCRCTSSAESSCCVRGYGRRTSMLRREV